MPDSDNSAPHMLGFLLTEGFPLMAYAAVIEPFRAANILARRPLYAWRHLSADGSPVAGSHGAATMVEAGIEDAPPLDRLFVLAGGDPFAIDDRKLFAWLRRQARGSVPVAGISGGPAVLARAGLLDGYRATIHWEHQLRFQTAFPNVIIDPGLYVIDRQRLTCAGGTAGLDFAIDLIERDHGATLANRISEWFIRTDPRRADRSQRLGLKERYGITDDRLLRTLGEMEANIEEPADRTRLAQRARLSVRQLERLCRRHLGSSIDHVYMGIRLEYAAHLLRATSMDVTDVSLACGFRSVSHFSRSFKRRFGTAPSLTRPGLLGARQPASGARQAMARVADPAG